MFYCDPCANKHGWPITMFKSQGCCEMCRKLATCNEVKSSELPESKFRKDYDKRSKNS